MRHSFRRLGIFTIALALSGPLLAQTTTTPPKKKRAKLAAIPAAPAASQQDVQSLRDLVLAQQKQLESQNQQVQQLQSQLHEVLDAVQQSNATAQKLRSGAEQAQATAAEATSAAVSATSATSLLQTQAKAEETKLEAFQNVLGRFRLSGDIRMRGENFTQTDTQDRNRARVRIRLGLDGQLNEDFVGSIALATGSLGDPTTTNETLTNAFDRKTIALDRGYITYSPVAHSWLSLTGGKFPYLWQRTSVTGDPDLNPEGFDQKLSFNHNGFLQNFTVQAMELLYNENSTGQDSYVLGGQAQARVKAGPWTATASVLNQHWNRPDALLQASAFAVGATTTGGPVTVGTNKPVTVSFPVPGEGQGCSTNGNLPKFAPCAFAPNGMTNATFIDAAGKPHFYSGFDLLDFIVNNQIQTGASQFPINVLVEYEQNLDAAVHPL